ncbi:hypothetical protein E5676_scaffold3341G00060 [Cucumis melo var. makuwa]|uniref:Uncharacterized protein n=1 Tax=Cucumis melo var. makuwa TaxID=1194695 RepID=A0A5A7UEQ7_CUCMM|nr:hypothetical protein E6C27_scaffold1855G00090 [Cucumis melo var. makuwa]TYJ97781.1 hypothetical protein E5676_scaffold3341G00060 [Cucumis melo var. makuwa]
MAATLEEEVKKYKDESDSSKSDRHWKRPLKKVKVSGDDPDGRGSSALGVLDVPPVLGSDESLTGPHVVDLAIEEVATSKTLVSKPAE